LASAFFLISRLDSSWLRRLWNKGRRGSAPRHPPAVTTAWRAPPPPLPKVGHKAPQPVETGHGTPSRSPHRAQSGRSAGARSPTNSQTVTPVIPIPRLPSTRSTGTGTGSQPPFLAWAPGTPQSGMSRVSSTKSGISPRSGRSRDEEAAAQREFIQAALQLSAEELRDFIDDHVRYELALVMRMPPERRAQGFRQLCAEWHPDKCPGITELATEVFQRLQAQKARVLQDVT